MMETVKSVLGTIASVQTKFWLALGIVIAIGVGVWFLISTGKSLEKAKVTEQRIEIIQKSNEVSNEIKSLPPAARDKRLDGWVRDSKHPPAKNSGNGK